MSEQLKNGFSIPEIEQATISALMQWPTECFPLLKSSGIRYEAFSDNRNQLLLKQLCDLELAGKPIELISFTSGLRESNLLQAAGDAPYITQTWCYTCYSSVAFSYYLDILIESHAKRAMMKIAHEKTKEARAPGTDGAELITSTIKELSDIPLAADKASEGEIKTIALEELSRIEEGQPDADVIVTGIAKLDQESPLRHGDLCLIVGERKAGKSIFALSIIANVARSSIPILYFSLEDRKSKIIKRLYAGMSRVPMHKHHASRLNPTEVAQIQAAYAQITSWKLSIRDDVYDVARVIGVAGQECSKNNIGLIVVDYAQLVRSQSGRKDQNREQEVASVSRQLRLFAMETGVPIILLCQLNAEGATRESRALEQDATACWHISSEEDEPEIRWINVPWQRNGRSGIHFKVTFLGEIARVENYSEDKLNHLNRT